MYFTVGCDPEIFVGDNNSVRSIIGKVGGTKELPLPLPIGDGFAVQEDNVALEFNIPPSDSKSSFVHNLNQATGFLEQMMLDMHGLKFVRDSAISFPKEEMNDPRAFMFGCEPDFNCWTGRVNPKPKAKDPLLRSCGGHVHIGPEQELDVREVAKGCDLVLAVPSIHMDKGFMRKELYGKAGAYRPKPFGLEYRVLSNFWIFDNKTIEWVYDGVDRVLEMVSNGVKFDEDRDDIINAINTNNTDLANKLINKYNLSVL